MDAEGDDGMKRYQFGYGCLEYDEDEGGEHVLYEEAHQIEVDRDIKAANLHLLVEKVLDYKEAADSAVGGLDHIDTYEAERLLDDTVALARSLKQ